MQSPPSIKIAAVADSLLAEFRSLEEFADLFPESVAAFLNGFENVTQLVSIHSESGGALGAGHARVTFEPSESLVKFVAAMRTRQAH